MRIKVKNRWKMAVHLEGEHCPCSKRYFLLSYRIFLFDARTNTDRESVGVCMVAVLQQPREPEYMTGGGEVFCEMIHLKISIFLPLM